MFRKNIIIPLLFAAITIVQLNGMRPKADTKTSDQSDIARMSDEASLVKMELLEIVSLLKTEPLKTLKMGNVVRLFALREIFSSPVANCVSRFNEIMEKWENVYPLFLLDECQQDNCPLNRTNFPEKRCVYSNKVSESILEMLNQKKKTRYIEFAAGAAFSVAETLAKVLSNKRDAQFDVHVIEPKDVAYVAALDRWQGTRLILKDNLAVIDVKILMELMEKLKNYCHVLKVTQEDKRSACTTDTAPLSEQDLELNIENTNFFLDYDKMCREHIVNYLWQARQYKQIISFTKAAFPKANVNIYVHNSASSYLKYMGSRKANSAYSNTILAAADISGELMAMLDFNALENKISKRSSSAISIKLNQNFPYLIAKSIMQ